MSDVTMRLPSRRVKRGGYAYIARGVEVGDDVLPTTEADVVEVGAELESSVELIDKAYEVFTTMMANGWHTDSGATDVADVVAPYRGGVYALGTRRVIIANGWDQINDDVPSQLALAVEGQIYSLREVEKLPRAWSCAAPGRRFIGTVFGAHERWENELDTASRPVVLAPDGRIVAAFVRGEGEPAAASLAARMLAALTVNVWCDRIHVWQVETSEDLLGGRHKTPLTIGVNEEHIKSLCYARTLPVTATGRRRPILHWVQAHQRRMREGIEIDIRRHLRGINEFEMDGFPMDSRRPSQPQPDLAARRRTYAAR